MNRNQIAALLIAVGGSVAGGFALVSSSLSPAGQYIVECAPPDGDCVLVTVPAVDQCPVLLEGGGDRPGEASGLDGDGAQAARVLYAMMEAQAINGFRTIVDGAGCKVAIALSRQQARAWRATLTGEDGGGSSLGEGVAILSPATATGIPVQWGGAPSPEERVEAFDLSAVDGGTL
jgi:hypothetical protein